MDAIRITDLTKVYAGFPGKGKAPALDRLNLIVGGNEIFGFLGANGAGKTTTIKILCSLLKPTRGHAEIFGENVRTRAARRLIGYLPENPYFYEYLTPRETLDFYGRLHGLGAAQRAAEWERLSGLLDLRHIAAQRVRGFSKGMRQRLGFAVALVGDPSVLILDEPMSGLDPVGRHNQRRLILQLREEKKTIFFSSHVLGDVQQICDRVGILNQGKLIAEGRIDELLESRVQGVEVIISGLDGQALTALADCAAPTRRSEAGHHFMAPTLEDANRLAARAHELGGALVEFAPVRETLEDFFMRKQGHPPSGAANGSAA